MSGLFLEIYKIFFYIISMFKIISFSLLFILLSCGGGTSYVGSNQPSQASTQPDPIAFKNVPQGISIFE